MLQQVRHRVPLAATAIGALSFFLPLLIAKENRIVSGNSLYLSGLSWWISIIYVLFLIGVIFTCIKAARKNYLVFNVLGLFQIIFTSALVVISPLLIRAHDINYARISFGLGFWTGIPAAYILASYGGKYVSAKLKYIISFTAIAALIFILLNPMFADYSIYQEWTTRRTKFFSEFVKHIQLSAFTIQTASVTGFMIGILAWRNGRLRGVLFSFVNTVQTIPSLALFGVLIAPLSILSFRFPALRAIGIKGIGFTPAFIALTLYALLPITQNTFLGLQNISPAISEAGRGMGMSGRQLFFRVQIPLSLPVIMAGIRTAAVQTVGNVAVAALIGAGGLGTLVFQGLGQSAPDLILLGVIPIILLAVATDRIFSFVQKAVSSKGILLEVESDRV